MYNIKGTVQLTANDPETENDPQMDRKWSSTASDPQSRPQMIPWKIKKRMDFVGLITKKDWL